MTDITELFDSLLQQAGSTDIAEAEFKRLLADDAELRELYAEWCHAVGSSEKDGFADYCEDVKSNQDDIWDTLNDFDE